MMSSSSSSSAAFYISLNLLFFACAFASEYGTYYNTPTTTNPTPYYPKPTNPSPYYPKPTPTPAAANPAPYYPKPTPSPAAAAYHQEYKSCPRDTLKLGACAKLFKGALVNTIIGYSTKHDCCALIDGLVDTQAALCLCTALKANVIGVKLEVDIAVSLFINTCRKELPPGFKCT